MKSRSAFRIVLGRIAHAALGQRPTTLCGRSLMRHPQRSWLCAAKAYRRTECLVCRSVFHPQVRKNP